MSGTDRIVIEGIGVVGGFGCGIHDLSRALTGSACSPGTLDLSTGSGPVTIPAFRADVSRLEEFLPVRTLRRIDHFSRLGLLGSHLALADAELPEAERPRLGIIIASGYGATGITYAFLKSFINDGDICASPTYFASSVHNSAAAHISIQLGAKGPNLTVSDFHLSVPSALATARIWLAEERVQRVLFGAVDELSELIGYIRYRTRDASPAAPMTPLRTEMETSIPAEGAAFLLLARESASRGGYCTLDASTTGSAADSRLSLSRTGLAGSGGGRLPRIGPTIRGGGAKCPRRVLHPPVRVHAGRTGLRPGGGRAHPQGGARIPFPGRRLPRLPRNGSRRRRTGRRRSDLLPHARRRRGVRIDDARTGWIRNDQDTASHRRPDPLRGALPGVVATSRRREGAAMGAGRRRRRLAAARLPRLGRGPQLPSARSLRHLPPGVAQGRPDRHSLETVELGTRPRSISA